MFVLFKFYLKVLATPYSENRPIVVRRPFEQLKQQLNHRLPFELELDALRLLALINDKCAIDFKIAQTFIQQDNHEEFLFWILCLDEIPLSSN
ncbi:hypothetical protein ACN38_g751 [Penicillium nordicum]|uniref:Uncharacterized protein n=1 Tax=Penicillium nordicum TaxID=229535 RepID=A0A0M9WKI0_9EURO|nr:hypothetical protein ACN38_g751 [Penicillium nordicum]